MAGKGKEKGVIKEFDIDKAVDEAIQEMVKDKQENPSLVIPYSFLEFYNRPEMLDLIGTVHGYSKSLVLVNSAFLQLKREGRFKEAGVHSEKEKILLAELGRTIAKKYGQILLRQKSLVSLGEEQNFFETIIFFAIKVVKSGFSIDQAEIIEDELNRLFRSTAFNLCQRKKIESDHYLRFPQLKQSPKRDTESIISNIMIRQKLQKFQKKSYSLEGISRPAFVKISPYKAINSRSPLISMLLPAPKDRIRQFEELRKKLLIKKSMNLSENSLIK